MRARFATAILAAALLFPATVRADQTVVATDRVFTPADVTVLQGESVTWTNGGGAHNVRFDDNSFVMPAAPDPGAWSVTRRFDTVGVFRYHCTAHGYPNGVDMSGAVYVKPAAAGDRQQLSADRTAPALTLSGPRRQKVLRQRAVVVHARVNEASRLVAKGWVSIPGTGKSRRPASAVKRLAPGTTAKLKLRFPGHAVRTFRQKLRKRARLTARITVIATDAAGNRTAAKRRVRFKK